MRYENNTAPEPSHPGLRRFVGPFHRTIDSARGREYRAVRMRFSTAWSAIGVALLALFLIAPSSGCGKKPKYPACGSDKDCKDGEHCVNKQCLQCGEDSHCKEGEKCVEGGCVAQTADDDDKDDDDGLKPCSVDTDCEDDEDCIEGKCRRPWESDTPEGVTCQLETVYFGYDADSVSEEYREALTRTADCIKSAPADRGVYITGYTDPRGTEEYNIALSERRARSVADYLANLGIDPARFQIVPKGEAEASGFDEDSWQQDRRVQFDWK
jgi:peptidoglycan-associated lipoprotein